MEKGNAKNSSSKSNSCDSKNKQDIPNKYFRLPRVKDNVSSRPDVRRKSNPQRNRELFDKRPRNKTGAVCERYRSEVADGAVGETFAKQGSKKTNLNHLLNFTLAPLDNWEGSGRRPIHNRTKLPKYNKELFLQANCQFIARDSGNYSVHQKNPDILVEWSLIEEIRLPCHEVPLCPICLYVPVAAKITRCGHIYCWPCVLHYLSLTDKSWQKCPICFEAVHKTELKSVSLRVQKSFTVGDEITMCLMKREKGSLFSVPVIEQKSANSLCNVDEVDSVTRFQKLLLACPKRVQLIINRERMELNLAYEAEKDTPEVCFIEAAMKLLEEREQNLNQILDSEVNKEHENMVSTTRKHLTSISSTGSADESVYLENEENPVKPGNFTLNNNLQNPQTDPGNKNICYFYQAEDGQHIYMHNVNVRMLLKEYGSLEFAPPVLIARLVEVESITMTEILRKRLRYLQHLPLTCEFQVVELDFNHLVSELTVQQFEGEIKRRKMYRSKKLQSERRREKKIEEEENRKLGKYPKATYNLKSNYQFPICNPEDFSSLSPPESGTNLVRSTADPKATYNLNSNYQFPICNTEDFSSLSPPESGTNLVKSTADGNISDLNGDGNILGSGYSDEFAATEPMYCPVTSFAQKLKAGPKLFTSIPKEFNRTSMLVSSQQAGVDSDGEECTAAPEYHQSFSDSIQAALDAVTLKEPSDNNQSSSKKKKKGKKQLLFTTSMNRNNF